MIPCVYLKSNNRCGVTDGWQEANCPCADYSTFDPLVEMANMRIVEMANMRIEEMENVRSKNILARAWQKLSRLC